MNSVESSVTSGSSAWMFCGAFNGSVLSPFADEGVCTLTDCVDPVALCASFRFRPNQWGNPCLRLKQPAGSRSSSLALKVPASPGLAVNEYVVNGTMRGWNISVVNVSTGGTSG